MSKVENVEHIIDKFDSILDKLRSCFLAFFGMADFAIGQLGFASNAAISLIEPEDFLNWLFSKYITDFLPKIKKFIPDVGIITRIFRSFMNILGKPLDTLGNLDLFINPEKLTRLRYVYEMLNTLKGLKDKMTSSDPKVDKILNLILNKLF